MDDERIRELFDGLGPVTFPRMFGGTGVYRKGEILAPILRGELMLKGDETIATEYEAAGRRRWTYRNKRRGTEVAMPYWTAPDSALDEPDKMSAWARKAYEAGLRSET